MLKVKENTFVYNSLGYLLAKKVHDTMPFFKITEPYCRVSTHNVKIGMLN
jgi:predicted aconitase